jgi:hypothetical protein
MWRAILLVGFLFLPLRVSAQETPTPVFAGEQDYHLESEIDVVSPFVGQEVTYTIRLYSVDSDPGTVELPNFTGFWQGITLEARSRAEIFNNIQFVVIEQDIKLYPLRSGNLTITLAYYVGKDGGRFASNTLQMDVQPLPEGAPDGFDGAVGQYLDMVASIDSQPITLGDPVTLQLTITGIGNLEQLPAPEPSLPDGWRVYANSPEIRYTQGVVLLGEKSFEWIFVPNQAGSQSIPAVKFTYFDPRNMEYRSLETLPITFEVQPDASANSELPPSQIFSPGAELLPLKPLSADSLGGAVYPNFGFWLLWAIAPTAAFAAWLSIYRKQRIQANLLRFRQSRALRHARKRLEMARKYRNQQAYYLICDAIYTYLGDKLNCQASELNISEIQVMVKEQELQPSAWEKLLSCLMWAEEGRYAPVGTQDVRPLVSQTSEALGKLDAVWKAK